MNEINVSIFWRLKFTIKFTFLSYCYWSQLCEEKASQFFVHKLSVATVAYRVWFVCICFSPLQVNGLFFCVCFYTGAVKDLGEKNTRVQYCMPSYLMEQYERQNNFSMVMIITSHAPLPIIFLWFLLWYYSTFSSSILFSMFYSTGKYQYLVKIIVKCVGKVTSLWDSKLFEEYGVMPYVKYQKNVGRNKQVWLEQRWAEKYKWITGKEKSPVTFSISIFFWMEYILHYYQCNYSAALLIQ